MTRNETIETSAIKVVSGGQTGVDRAALDAALGARVECGGWCPRGRRAEDGPIAVRYPLEETASADYAVRTRCNVADADATVIIYFDRPRGGTELTLHYCLQLEQPHLLIDAGKLAPSEAAGRIADFHAAVGARVLNFAGPRASSEARAYAYTLKTVSTLLADLGHDHGGN